MSWKVGQEAVFIYADNPEYKPLVGTHVTVISVGQITAYDWLNKKDVVVDCTVQFHTPDRLILGCHFYQLAPLIPHSEFESEEIEDVLEAA